jgi:hypothetical protein
VPVVVLNCKMSQLRKSIWEEKRAQACILSKEGYTGIFVGLSAKRYNGSVKLALIMTDQDQAAPETPQNEKMSTSLHKVNVIGG